MLVELHYRFYVLPPYSNVLIAVMLGYGGLKSLREAGSMSVFY